MTKVILFLLMASVLLTTAPAVQAQQPAKKIARVAILSLTPAPVQKDRIEAFREALRKFGHFEGQNINFEYGGNITGLTNITLDPAGKRIELLKEIILKLARVAVLRDLTNVTEETAGS